MLSKWCFLCFRCSFTSFFSKNTYNNGRKKRKKEEVSSISFDAREMCTKKNIEIDMIFHLMWIIYIHSKYMRAGWKKTTWKTRLTLNEIMWFDCDFEAIDLTPKVFLHLCHFSLEFGSFTRSTLFRQPFSISYPQIPGLFFNVLFDFLHMHSVCLWQVKCKQKKYWWNEVTVALLMFY